MCVLSVCGGACALCFGMSGSVCGSEGCEGVCG